MPGSPELTGKAFDLALIQAAPDYVKVNFHACSLRNPVSWFSRGFFRITETGFLIRHLWLSDHEIIEMNIGSGFVEGAGNQADIAGGKRSIFDIGQLGAIGMQHQV